LHVTIDELTDWKSFVNRPDFTLRALELEERYRFTFWDALIVNAAESSAATILYSENFTTDSDMAPCRF